MATSVDRGKQKLSFDYKAPAKGQEFNRLLFSVVKPGIYRGMDVSSAGGDTVNITPGHAFLNTVFQSQNVRTTSVEFQTTISNLQVTQSVAGQNELLYLYFEYKEITDNYVDFRQISVANINLLETNAVILCEFQYDGSGNITNILYNRRSYGLFDYNSGYTLPDINLKFSNYLDKNKRFKFNVGRVTSGQTRTINVPDHDFDLGSIDDWTNARTYNIKEVVVFNNTIYRCNTLHTSSSDFFTDLSYWDNITQVQDEEITRGFSTGGSLAGRVVKIIGDYPSQEIPEIGYISAYSDEPYGVVISNITAGQSGEVIQRGRLTVAGFNSSAGVVGQKLYCDSSGNLTLTITPIVVGQVITPAVSNSVIYVGILPTEEGINPINFNGQLSSAENTIQKAFDRLDDYGYLPQWQAGRSYRIGNPVVNTQGSVYRCIVAHTSSDFNSDIANWQEQGINIDAFNGQLSASETSIQKAFDRLDDYGYIPQWVSGAGYRVNNVVFNSQGSLYKCITAHTSSTSIDYTKFVELGINTDNFNGQLNASESSIQKALDRIDDHGYIPDWATSVEYRVGNVVVFNGIIYRCIIAHTSVASFYSDTNKWFIYEGIDSSNFNGQLSVSENTIQKAFDRLDDYGYIPDWVSGASYRLNNVVIASSGVIYKCSVAHISSGSFSGDISNWVQVNEAPIIASNPDYYYAGDRVFREVQKEQVGGLKITDFPEFDGVKISELNFTVISIDSNSGAINSLSTSGSSFVKLTGTTVTVNGVQAPSGNIAQYLILTNTTNDKLVVANQSLSASASDRIITGTGKNIKIPVNATIALVYDYNSTRWRIAGGSGVGTGSGLEITNIKYDNYTAIPFELVLVDTNTAASGFTITLPSAPDDADVVGILDVGGALAVYNLTVSSSNLIQNVNESWSIDINNTYLELVYSSITSSWYFKEVPAGLSGIAESQSGSSSTLAYNQNFTNANLVAGKLTVTHSLNVEYPIVQVYDDGKLQIIPTEVKSIDANTIEIDLTSYGTITGTWRLRAI